MLNCCLTTAEVQGIEAYRLAKYLKKLIIILPFYQITDDLRIVRLHQTVIEYLSTSFVFYQPYLFFLIDLCYAQNKAITSIFIQFELFVYSIRFRSLMSSTICY